MHAIALANAYISRSIAVLAALCAVCVFLYGFFLLEAVAHTASRSAAQHQITTLAGKLGVLEGKYLSDSRTLTPAIAAQLGYVAPAAVSSVYAHSPSLLTLRDVRY